MPTAVERFQPIFEAAHRHDERLVFDQPNLGLNIRLLLPAVHELLPAVKFGGLVSGKDEFPTSTEPTF